MAPKVRSTSNGLMENFGESKVDPAVPLSWRRLHFLNKAKFAKPLVLETASSFGVTPPFGRMASQPFSVFGC